MSRISTLEKYIELIEKIDDYLVINGVDFEVDYNELLLFEEVGCSKIYIKSELKFTDIIKLFFEFDSFFFTAFSNLEDNYVNIMTMSKVSSRDIKKFTISLTPKDDYKSVSVEFDNEEEMTTELTKFNIDDYNVNIIEISLTEKIADIISCQPDKLKFDLLMNLNYKLRNKLELNGISPNLMYGSCCLFRDLLIHGKKKNDTFIYDSELIKRNFNRFRGYSESKNFEIPFLIDEVSKWYKSTLTIGENKKLRSNEYKKVDIAENVEALKNVLLSCC